MKTYMVSAILLIIFLSACVTTQDATELQETADYYKEQALKSDSISTAYRNLQEDKRLTEAELNDLMNEMERMRATNISLNRSYQEVLSKFNDQIDQNKEVVATTSYENQSLQERLYQNQSDLDERERQLSQTEFELTTTKRGLNMMEYNSKGIGNNFEGDSQKSQKMEAAITLQEQKMADLRMNVIRTTSEFTNEELSVNDRNGKIYLSLSEKLLFLPDSEEIDWRGKKALREVAAALNQNPDIEILVEGHTSAEGTASRNWDLSVLRATAVVKVLTAYGVAPERVTAAGRAYFAPIAQNNTELGKMQNRRTEIILSPRLDELYHIIQN